MFSKKLKINMRQQPFLKTLFILITLFAFHVSLFSQTDIWNITAKNFSAENYYGVTVANGMIGIVSSPTPLRVKDIVLNGAFDTYGRGRVSNIMKVFSFANMQFDVDGKRLGGSDFKNVTQNINLHDAIFTTSFDYSDVLSVKQDIMALRHLPFSALMVIEVTAKKNCEIIPASLIETPDNLKDCKNFYAEIDRPHTLISLMTSTARSPTGKLNLAASNTFLFDEAHGSEPRVIHEEWDNNMHLLKFKKNLVAGQTYRFAIVGSVISSAQSPDVQNEAERMTIYASSEKTDKLIARHKAAWAKLWESDIVLEGDDATQRDIHSAMYHLYSFVREGTSYSLSPMGLSGLGYNGHVFWDTELWMFPPLLALHPELALSPMNYRFKGIEAARTNASNYGYSGLKFPWEGDDTGQESTPVWALSGPFEQHITGCVGYAAWRYFQTTHDTTWLRTKGYPIISGTADFWANRAELGKDGKYHILNVVCADEWAENVDDNAFTNGIAKTVLGYATQAAEILGLKVNADWKKVGDGIIIQKFPDGTTREYATYKGDSIKQTDANLLSYPLNIVTDEATIKKDLDFYWKELGDNIPGKKGSSPAMAQAIFCILNARLGNTEKAYQQFVESYKPNGVPPFGVLSETAGGTNPYFATGAGGFLQTLIFGFGGLEFTDAGIVQKYQPKLPKGWKSLTLKGIGVNKTNFVRK